MEQIELYQSKYTNQNLMKGYLLCYLIFSFHILPDDLCVLAMVGLFAIAPFDTMVFMYLFSSVWTDLVVFSFGLTLGMAQTLLFAAKLIIYKRKSIQRHDLLMLMYLSAIGAIGIVLGRSGLSSMNIMLIFLICAVVSTDMRKNGQLDSFWKTAFLILMLTTLLGAFYGLLNGGFSSRWIPGMGTAFQFAGIIGTTRFGMFLCTAMIYPLFYLQEKGKWRWILLGTLLVLILLTISMTVIALAGFVLFYYYFIYKKNDIRKIGLLVAICTVILAVFFAWPHISQNKLIRPVALRVENIIDSLQMGNIDRATTGRAGLSEMYWDDFKSFSVVEQCFGSGSLNQALQSDEFDKAMNSHNSYLDMLKYMGIVGVALFFFQMAVKLYGYRKTTKAFPQILLLKMIITIAAGTTSILTAPYWLIWIFI